MEKKIICPKCDYTAQVSGEEYFEVEFYASVGTRKCNNCNRLFDEVVSEVITQGEIDLQHKEYKTSNNHDDDPFSEYSEFLSTVKATKYRKKVKCFWCGSLKTEEWKKENPICPKCSSLMKESVGEIFSIINATDFPNLKTILNSFPKVVLCYIETSCSPCRHVEILIDEINKENPNEYTFVKFNYSFDSENNLGMKYRIKFLPTFLIFKEGKFVGKFSSFTSKQNFIYQLDKRFNKKEKNNKA